MATSKDKSVLAGVAGVYREEAPPEPLHPHFRCLWQHTVDPGPSGQIAVVPDGCVDLVWQGEGLFVAGPDVVASHPDLKAGAELIGVRFQPGAAVSWLGLPMREIVGRQIDLTEVWGPRARALAERLGGGRNQAVRVEEFQRALIGMLGQIAAPAREMRAAFAMIERGGQTHGLAHRLNLSERTLRRRFDEHFGYGPKMLERILRFQRFLTLARQEAMPLAEIAVAAGYTDQPHLNRDTLALSGRTPGRILQEYSASP